MKNIFRYLAVLAIGTLSLYACDDYDDSSIRRDIDDMRKDIEELRSSISTTNEDISSLQSIITAMQREDYVKTIINNPGGGYTITFGSGQIITIKDGVDGRDGEDGIDAPIMGILDDAGVYYWTITIDGNTTWLLDNHGNKIPTTGPKGDDGQDGQNGNDGQQGVCPVMGVDEQGYWTVDYGNGAQRVKDSNNSDIKAVGQDGTNGTNGANGADAPVIGVDLFEGSFYWTITTSGSTTWLVDSNSNKIPVTGAQGNSGTDGKTPIMGIDSEGYWTVNYGSGAYRMTGGDGLPVKAKGLDGATGDSFFAQVSVNENAGTVTFVLNDASNTSMVLPLYNAYMMFKVSNADGEQLILAGESKMYSVAAMDIVDLMITKPDGWRVTLNGDPSSVTMMTITAPAQNNTFAELSGKITIAAFDKNMQVTTVSISVRSDYVINIPDNAFATALQTKYPELFTDGKLYFSKASEATTIIVSGAFNAPGTIKSLKGIEYFTSLYHLDCEYNQISAIDVSTHPSLKYLRCGGNQISSIDVSNNPDLEVLSIFENKLTSLDVSSNSNLEHLTCSSNQLVSLEANNLASLQFLYCGGNMLSSLNLSKCSALTELYCNDNKLTSIDMSSSENLVKLVSKTQNLNISEETSVKVWPSFNDSAIPAEWDYDAATTKWVY